MGVSKETAPGHDSSSERDQEVFRLAQAGGQEAADDIFARVYPAVLETARNYKRTFPDAQGSTASIANSALLKLLRDKEIFTRAETMGYIYSAIGRSIRQVMVDRANAQRREKTAHRNALDDLIEDFEWERRIAILDLHSALEKFRRIAPEKHRVVEMSMFACNGLQEVADALEMSLSSVKRANQVGRAFLKNVLDQE
ncbi:MAG: ECF-type sigma factor [Pirellulaceae bacterium]|jgi:RNA polymerase sigma factor (TIGR02999 family)|nr:ECF-type sigma factor [Pirellulaceae bacterium]